MQRHSFFLGAIAVAFGLLPAAPQSKAAVDPGVFVNQLGNQGLAVVAQNVPMVQRVARFRQLFQADFDVNGIGRFAIGRYWQAYTPEQQQEFLRLFEETTVLAYADKLGQFDGARLQVISSEPAGNEVVVHSQVSRTNGPPAQIDWHLIQTGDGYKVTDVYVDRVSMKVTQREEFAKVIQNNGGQPSALLAVLRQQLRDQEHPATTRQ